MSKSSVKSSHVPSLPDKFISRGLRFPLIDNELSKLLGKVLTIVDASITDKVQCKAVKDLMRIQFGDTVHDTFWYYCYASQFDFTSDPYYKLNIITGELPADVQMPPAPPTGVAMPDVHD